MPIQLNNRELATVLAALRYWQQELAANQDGGPISPDHFDDKVTPLTVEEIDELCVRLNLG
jgi:hypothetical protein